MSAYERIAHQLPFAAQPLVGLGQDAGQVRGLAAHPVAAHRIAVAGLGEPGQVPRGHPGGLPISWLVLVGRQRTQRDTG